jgi:hypothetical protein
MLRLKKHALIEKEGKFFYEGNLFSGIAFDIANGMLVNAMQISDGIETRRYTPKYYPASDCQIVDMEILKPESEDDYEPFLCLNGERFNGIALEFDGVFCTGELLYVRGWSDSQVTYFKTGQLESIELIEDGFSQIYQCYDGKQIKKYEISVRNLFSFNLEYNEDGNIRVLGLDGDWLNQMKVISTKLTIPHFKHEDFLDELKAGRFLSISGSSITDRLFKRLVASGVLEQVEVISIFYTALTTESLRLLQEGNRLNKLLVSSDLLSLDDVRLFKSARQECYVEFNGEEVLA